MRTVTYTLKLDASPLAAFVEILEGVLKRGIRPVGLPRKFRNFPADLARCEAGTARAGVIPVRLYPSDRLLDFAAALWAAQGNLGRIKHS
jgi:hypothetical protein